MRSPWRFWRGPGIKRLLTAHEERERTFAAIADTLEVLEVKLLEERASIDRGLAAIRRIKEREEG